jgi:hypothetical protein
MRAVLVPGNSFGIARLVQSREWEGADILARRPCATYLYNMLFDGILLARHAGTDSSNYCGGLISDTGGTPVYTPRPGVFPYSF